MGPVKKRGVRKKHSENFLVGGNRSWFKGLLSAVKKKEKSEYQKNEELDVNAV